MFSFLRKRKVAPPVEMKAPTFSPVDEEDVLIKDYGEPPTRLESEVEENSVKLLRAEAFSERLVTRAADGSIKIKARAADDATMFQSIKSQGMSAVPNSTSQWYMSQGFMGWQSCALIAQHWLVDKACSMPARDATRNGYELSEPDGKPLDKEILSRVMEYDRKMKVLDHCVNFVKFTNIFGLRVVLFKVDSDDPRYYERPFNIDGVRPGSYKGMVQIDPIWIVPVLDDKATSDPTSENFYNPTYWVINGRRYHHSHLHIGRGATVADILKPSYYWGGVSLVQRIYERVYAAERTANEAPMLALSKRTTILKANLAKVGANFAQIAKRLAQWVKFRDNHGVRLIDKEEEMVQQDTSLANFDDMVSSQYQLVSAIAEVPYTKLMATSPKGFGATGEYEELSYHEKLESTQAEMLTPLMDGHHIRLVRSMGLGDLVLNTVWNPVGTKTPEQLAELNKKKNEAGQILIDSGVISSQEERHRVRTDKHSGYSSLIEMADELSTNHPSGVPAAPVAQTPAVAAPTQPAAVQTPAVAPVRLYNERNQVVPSVEPSVKPTSQGVIERPSAPSAPAPAPYAEIISMITKMIEVIDANAKSELKTKAADEDTGRYAVEWKGFKLMVETLKNEYRHHEDGSSKMPHDYGYFEGVTGADGDSLDCFIGPDLESGTVFVVNQKKPDGSFDEHKVMVGFTDEREASAAYDAAYEAGWTGKGTVIPMDYDSFVQWLSEGNMDLPAQVGTELPH